MSGSLAVEGGRFLLASTDFFKEEKEECVCYSFVQVITVIGFKISHLLFELFGEMSMQLSVKAS